MSQRLARPNTDRFPPLDASYLRAVPVGTLVGRIYRAGGAHPATWGSFRSFGPTKARFDHQPPPPREHPTRRITYVAPAIPGPTGHTYPVLKTCMAETYRDRGAVETTRDDPYLALFETTRQLLLLDLGESDWITTAGGNGAISSGLRSSAREWAHAIYRHYDGDDAPDGLIYPTSNIPQPDRSRCGNAPKTPHRIVHCSTSRCHI